jgi:3-isopropylmalate/(R)-2-methylmalate dehydratase large subunit
MTSAASILLLPGRVLFLSTLPDRVAAQLQGELLDLSNAGPLRDDISTDEITPVSILSHYDEKLGRYPYTGYQAGEKRPIGWVPSWAEISA